MNDIEIIKKNYGKRNPKTNEIFIDTLDENDKNLYFNLYYAYSILFNQYIINILNLKKYDDLFKDEKLCFVPIEEKDMDLYQYMSKDDLKYIYIRNNLYIERLTTDEKSFLIESISDLENKSEIELYNFVKNTYKKVIFENVSNNGSICETNFGPITPKYFAKNNSLVLGIRYDQYNIPNVNDEEWNVIHKKQITKISELCDKLLSENKDKIDIPLYIIKYDDNSIDKIIYDEYDISKKVN